MNARFQLGFSTLRPVSFQPYDPPNHVAAVAESFFGLAAAANVMFEAKWFLKTNPIRQ
jgi:hypothetical protein